MAMIGQAVRQARENEFPFVVPLLFNNHHTVDLMRFCTGTLITNKDVLTAEHCLEHKEPEDVVVLVGTIDLSRGTKCYVKWWITYNQWALLDGINIEFQKNDLAIIRVNYSFVKIL
jgi:secreted trypsin-like serine protease